MGIFKAKWLKKPMDIALICFEMRPERALGKVSPLPTTAVVQAFGTPRLQLPRAIHPFLQIKTSAYHEVRNIHAGFEALLSQKAHG